MRRVYQRYLFPIIFVGLAIPALATHVRSADLKVEPVCDPGDGFTYTITIIAYLNSGSTTQFGTNSQLIFGDGITLQLPRKSSTPRPDLGVNISVVFFEVTHTYSTPGTYTVTYMERDRNANILNIFNSTDVPYVTFTQFTIDSNNLCNNLPVLSVPPLDKACHQVTFFHTSGAYDVDGDSLSYELSVPSESPSSFAQYTSPVAVAFYPTNFNIGNEDDTGPPIFQIDSFNGLLTWNAPGMLGEYNIAFKIIEWRKNPTTNQYIKLSTTTRDMQIVVEPCANKKPELVVPGDVCVMAGDMVNETILGKDDDSHDVKIEVFSLTVDLNSDEFPATYTPNPGVFLPSSPPAELQFQWQTDCVHVRNQAYQVVFKITDNPPTGPKLVTFKIWNIKVIAPPPVLQNTTLDIVNSNGVLNWDAYTCANASSIQVWRKVDSYMYEPGLCVVGIPRSVGYNLIATVPATETSFRDNNAELGLSPGAMYCYRLVAYFNAPASTPSIVSSEMCIGPVQADAPIITHVSVDKTAETEGSIRVSWRSPFNINATQFPKATYEYEVYRADDFIGNANIVKAGRTADTTFLDDGINTEEKVFNYRVVLYAQPQLAPEKIPVDTSAVASSERLSITPKTGLISLAWHDSVPWSNVFQTRPYHRIYRGVDDADPAHMVLYDSANVAITGFEYIDDGPLEDDRQYSYKILTRGTYGNPAIALQENFSQVVSAYTVSNLKPCSPLVTINAIDCDEYLASSNCDQTVFSNTLRWSVSGLRGCRKNIDHFNIYFSATEEGDFILLATATDTVYIDGNLPSFARCYKISAVDKQNVESPLSKAFCNDNCPYFTLPNVFTPGVADGFNDTFSAKFDLEVVASSDDVVIRCPRFVEQVKFEVYNRWGEQVYLSTSNNGGSRNIEWSGVDSKGRELGAGVYYYTAEVQFNVSDPTKQFKEYRGWVKLVR
jgi:hypothetical protein